MVTVSYSFKSPKPKDSTGTETPETSAIPMFKGRKYVRLKTLIRELDEAQDYLAYTPCAFWACRGPLRPKAMCTCCKCSAMRNIGRVRAALNMALIRNKDLRQAYSR